MNTINFAIKWMANLLDHYRWVIKSQARYSLLSLKIRWTYWDITPADSDYEWYSAFISRRAAAHAAAHRVEQYQYARRKQQLLRKFFPKPLSAATEDYW